MTLAEVFLFVLFVVWWSNAADVEEASGVSVDTANLNSRIHELEGEVAKLSAENNQFKEIVEMFRQLLNPVEVTPQAFRSALEKHDVDIAVNARRVKPKCAESNTLVRVQLIDGSLNLTILGAEELLKQLGAWQVNETLSDDRQISVFLDSIEKYSRAVDCRFDYRLLYRTPEDYTKSRQRFEGYFYPERIIHVDQ
jgi:hypothetical protein